MEEKSLDGLFLCLADLSPVEGSNTFEDDLMSFK